MWSILVRLCCNVLRIMGNLFCSDIQLSPKFLLGFKDGKRPLFVVAGGEHTVAVCGIVSEAQDSPLGDGRFGPLSCNSILPVDEHC